MLRGRCGAAARGTSVHDVGAQFRGVRRHAFVRVRRHALCAEVASNAHRDRGVNYRTCGPVQAELTGGLFVHSVRRPRGLALVSYGAEIASRIADDCFAWLDALVRRIGASVPVVGYAPRRRGS